MSFNYNRRKKHDGQDSMWTSYSDLFLGLSIIFLLLYVTASLRQGTDGIRQHLEYKQLSKEAQDLRQQLKVYNALKQNYLEKEANQDEQATYAELMKKLDLLQDEAKEEKIKLRNEALENEKKELALNKYQQLIRNIINSNMIAKSRIKNRDILIDTKEEVIGEQKTEIRDLEKTVSQKRAEIAAGESKIENLEGQLEKRLKQLRSSYKSQAISKKKFEQQQAALQQEASQKIQALRAQNATTAAQLAELNDQLEDTSTELQSTKGQLAAVGAAKSKLEQNLKNMSAQQAAEVAKLRGDFENQRAKDRQAFEAQLAKEKLSGAERAAREARFRAAAAEKARELEGKLGELGRKYQGSQQQLAKAMENLNAKKTLASQIKKKFQANGVGAEVDPESGDVILSFGDQYFDTGKSSLKPGMRKILEQAVPLYSQSLFENQKVAEKIQSVEIVGFASPTFRGKYVDPKSLKPEDREAVNYNLDLSFNRARSIFNHVFDKNKMSFKHQQRLLPLVKVTGRSFLAQDQDKISTDLSKGEAFCQKNDCAKLQRVIIKFTLKD